jgi:hypothetical protein
MRSLEFFIDLILPAALNRNEYKGHLLGGKGGRCVGLANLTILMFRLPRNPESLNLLEISQPVQTCNGIVSSIKKGIYKFSPLFHLTGSFDEGRQPYT